MLDYHVTCNSLKKAISLEDDSTIQDLQNKISQAFLVEKSRIRSIQVFNREWDDWLDIDELLPLTKSKLLVVVVEDDRAKQDTMASMPAVQVTDRTVETMQVDAQQTAPNVSNSSTWHLDYCAPEMPMDVKTLLKAGNTTLLTSRKWRSKIVQVLFEDVIRHTWYPSSLQYTEAARALVRKYPILKDRGCNTTGFDTWRHSLIIKFKHERNPLVTEDVVAQKTTYGVKGKKRTSRPPSPLKKAKRPTEEMAIGEDRASIQRHVDDLQMLAGQRNPDQNAIRDKMRRTFPLRSVMITEQPLSKILETFPILKSARQLLSELKLNYGSVDLQAAIKSWVDQSSTCVLQEAESIAACRTLLQMYNKELDEEADPKKKQELTISACCLLLPLIMGERDIIYVIEKEPVGPTPALVIRGHPFNPDGLHVEMDGTQLCSCTSISEGIAAAFATYYAFGVEYPNAGKKTNIFIQHCLAKLEYSKQLPQKVQRLINLMSQ